jgi:hypothetical protein
MVRLKPRWRAMRRSPPGTRASRNQLPGRIEVLPLVPKLRFAASSAHPVDRYLSGEHHRG